MLNSESSIPSSKNWGVILCFIVMAAIFLRVYWAAGFIPKDDAEFAKVAYEMSQGTFELRVRHRILFVPERIKRPKTWPPMKPVAPVRKIVRDSALGI